jgi:hypothetical protein
MFTEKYHELGNDLDKIKEFFDKFEKDNKQHLFEGAHNAEGKTAYFRAKEIFLKAI